MSWLNRLRRQFLCERRHRPDRRLWNGGGPGIELRACVRRADDRDKLACVGDEEGDQPRGRIDWDPMKHQRREY